MLYEIIYCNTWLEVSSFCSFRSSSASKGTSSRSERIQTSIHFKCGRSLVTLEIHLSLPTNKRLLEHCLPIFNQSLSHKTSKRLNLHQVSGLVHIQTTHLQDSSICREDFSAFLEILERDKAEPCQDAAGRKFGKRKLLNTYGLHYVTPGWYCWHPYPLRKGYIENCNLQFSTSRQKKL